MVNDNRSTSGSSSPVFIKVNPQKLTSSEGAIKTARLRSNSIDYTERETSNRPSDDLTGTGNDKFQWDPTSWHTKPIVQDVVYSSMKGVEKALQKLEALPPLVSPYEINNLQEKLRDAALGKAFVLQGGDCAELFDYCSQERIESKMKILLQMSLVLIWGTKLPLVRIGRIAGQFAKPRSKLTEEVNGQVIPSFRGDNINGFDVSERTPDPSRLVSAYFHSAATLNYIRSSLSSGFADLHRPFDWSLSHVQSSAVKARYRTVVDAITEGLSFMKTVGADKSSTLESIDFYTSHEGLMLEFEQSLTRKLQDPRNGERKWYNTSAHFLWIGDRTRQVNGAHVEYFRGIMNPVGVKVGPSMTTDELVSILDVLDSDYVVGKVTLITRYGIGNISQILPTHIEAVKRTNHKVVWISDPCHGNTKSSTSGLKTRDFEDIMNELALALQIHKDNDSQLNGVHLELTGDAVTECIGGSAQLTHEDLEVRYDTVCDPRLSESQSLDVAFLIADWCTQGKMLSIAEHSLS
ncbi:DAHP synthetase [Lipomyces orientalis]|uniref:DAHP synthetase n=1 Tax=Lipomyces orientalis TaxID=1233043 RepID=A0ACC3TXQ3_9ASCO